MVTYIVSAQLEIEATCCVAIIDNSRTEYLMVAVLGVSKNDLEDCCRFLGKPRPGASIFYLPRMIKR
jgi:hypothetical protein